MKDAIPGNVQPPTAAEEEQWDRARTKLLASPYRGFTFGELAKMFSMSLPSTWDEETIGHYLQFSLLRLKQQRGVGKARMRIIQSLVLELESSLPTLMAISATAPATTAPTEQDLIAVLRQMELPESLPLGVTFFSSRVKDFAVARGCASLDDFTRYAANHGQSDLFKHRNFGRTSYAEIQRYVQALQLGSYSLLTKFLPVGANSGRLDLGTVTRFNAESHANVKTGALRDRLVLQRTLQEVADATGVTRERVRQVEKLLLIAVEDFLACVPSLRAALWQQWSQKGRLEDIPSEETQEIRELAAAAVSKIFEESPEGVRQEKELNRQIADLFDELRDEPSFYTGLCLKDYLATRPLPKSVWTVFEEECRNHPRLSYDEASGILKAECVHSKPVVAALLRRGVTAADEILAWLQKEPKLRLTEAALRRNWLGWRSDPEFPSASIVFSVRTVAEAKSGNDAVPKLPARTVDPELVECDRQISELINAQESPTICGLLPVPEGFAEKVLAALRRDCDGEAEKLESALAQAPAAAAYGVVAALAKEADGLAIWPPVSAGLGIAISLPRRASIARAFRRAIHAVGLVDCVKPHDGDNGEESAATWSITFQAGITPQLMSRFAAAVRAQLAGGLLPDLEDDVSLQRFAVQVAGRLPAGITRPRQILMSAAGAAVCKVVLAALKDGNLDRLPASWRTPLRVEMVQWAQRQQVLQNPSLGFSAERGIYIELPAQPAKARRANTHWLMRETGARYPADETTKLAVPEVPGSTVTLVIEQLQLETELPVFELPVKPSVEEPVMVFSSPGGKRLHPAVNAEGVIELPVGRDYFLVLAEEAACDLPEDDWSVTEQGLRWIIYASMWDQAEVNVSAGSVTRSIRPRRDVSLMIQTDGAGTRLMSVEGHLIYAGNSLVANIVLPSSSLLAGEVPRLEVPELGKVGLELLLDSGEGAEIRQATLPSQFARLLDGLAAGIHQLTFVVRGIRRSLRQSIYFWKGLQHVSPNDGFVCTGLANIDLDQLHGLQRGPRGLEFPTHHGQPVVKITLLEPAIRLSLARPGLSVELLQDAGPEAEVLPGTTLRVRDDEKKIVRFSASLSAPGSLLVDGRLWRKFSKGTATHTVRLGSLLQPGVAIASVLFEHADGRQDRLFRVVRERVFNHVWFADDEVNDRYYVRIGVPLETNANGLALRVAHLTGPVAAEPAIVSIPAQDGTHEVTAVAGPGFIALVNGRDHERVVELLIPKNQFSGRFAVMDLVVQTSDREWEPLLASNGHEPGVVRWVAHAPGPMASDPLARLLAAGQGGEAEPSLNAAEWSDAFARLQPLIHATYAYPCWENLRTIRLGYLKLGSIALKSEIARAAVFDLARQSALDEIRFRPILFAVRSELIALPADVFRLRSYPLGPIGQCFELAGLLAREKTIHRVLATTAGQAVDITPLAAFQANPGTAERPIAAASFLVELDRALRHAPTADSDSAAVFSPASWAHGFRQIRRRIERLRKAAPGTDSKQLSALRRFAQRRHRVSGRIDDLLGVQAARLACDELSFDEQSSEIASLVLLVTAAGRLTAHGYLTPETFRQMIADVFQKPWDKDDTGASGLALLLHFAPELFSSFFLLWEFACRAVPTPPRHE